MLWASTVVWSDFRYGRALGSVESRAAFGLEGTVERGRPEWNHRWAFLVPSAWELQSPLDLT